MSMRRTAWGAWARPEARARRGSPCKALWARASETIVPAAEALRGGRSIWCLSLEGPREGFECSSNFRKETYNRPTGNSDPHGRGSPTSNVFIAFEADSFLLYLPFYFILYLFFMTCLHYPAAITIFPLLSNYFLSCIKCYINDFTFFAWELLTSYYYIKPDLKKSLNATKYSNDFQNWKKLSSASTQRSWIHPLSLRTWLLRDI